MTNNNNNNKDNNNNNNNLRGTGLSISLHGECDLIYSKNYKSQYQNIISRTDQQRKLKNII